MIKFLLVLSCAMVRTYGQKQGGRMHGKPRKHEMVIPEQRFIFEEETGDAED